MTFNDALELFKRTLATERARPQVHGTMLELADPTIVGGISQSLQEALATGQRVWMTSDLHFGHGNIIGFCNRPFASVPWMNQHLQAQLAKVDPQEWFVIVGDLAMGTPLSITRAPLGRISDVDSSIKTSGKLAVATT